MLDAALKFVATEVNAHFLKRTDSLLGQVALGPVVVKPRLQRLALNAPQGSAGDPDAADALLHMHNIGPKRVQILLQTTGKFHSRSDVEACLNYSGLINE